MLIVFARRDGWLVDFDIFHRIAFALRIHRTRSLQGVPGPRQYTWRLVDLREVSGAKSSAVVPPSTPWARGATALLMIKAGRPDALAFNIQSHPGITAPAGIMAGNTRAYVSGSPDGAHYVLTTDAELKSLAAAATPPLALEIGEPVIVLHHEAWYSGASDSANASGTDGILDDVEVHGHMTLFWSKPDQAIE